VHVVPQHTYHIYFTMFFWTIAEWTCHTIAAVDAAIDTLAEKIANAYVTTSHMVMGILLDVPSRTSRKQSISVDTAFSLTDDDEFRTLPADSLPDEQILFNMDPFVYTTIHRTTGSSWGLLVASNVDDTKSTDYVMERRPSFIGPNEHKYILVREMVSGNYITAIHRSHQDVITMMQTCKE
jgi:hypothetical protein